MHNDRMLPRPRRHPVVRGAVALVLAPALLLAACSGDDEAPADAPSSAGSSSAAEEPYLPVPEGVELTEQGSELSLGDTATVAYEPRQDQVAALDLTVTKLEKATFKLFVGWKISDETKKTNPYFVHVKAENVGEGDLGGQRVPLYAVDGDNKLIESSTFASSFKPCPSESFPKKFENGDAFKTCLVYLAPDKGDLTAASFRPTEEFNPIVWTGQLTEATAADGKKADKKGDGKGDKKGADAKGKNRKNR